MKRREFNQASATVWGLAVAAGLSPPGAWAQNAPGWNKAA